ncbi:MAG: DUF2273 domain-containing protein [Desulfitobacteriaceae bacterium]|nr:DUF2273 domain-containing protein [Desulfitobacteriaceae bacterium]MDI6912978.1 DUF2273 domain-containing protein [Desulfitobacteriaceae bacterium]
MNGWQELITRFTRFFMWALAEHPGKLLGTSLGLLFGLLFVLIGFWRALILMAFVVVGFLAGKRYDEHKDLGKWLERIFH